MATTMSYTDQNGRRVKQKVSTTARAWTPNAGMVTSNECPNLMGQPPLSLSLLVFRCHCMAWCFLWVEFFDYRKADVDHCVVQTVSFCTFTIYPVVHIATKSERAEELMTMSLNFRQA
eukprot:scaffold2324_cov116-Cylindrotheca_fusiformis.AAC.12